MYRLNNKNLYPNFYIKSNAAEKKASNGTGFIELFVFTERGKEPIPDAVVTIYARTGNISAIPVKRLVTLINPITFDLPVAHPQGVLIEGPEYYFTTYNMKIEAEGYFTINVLNIRMFPNVTTSFDYNLNLSTPGLPAQEIYNYIPPHPRDLLR
ncbi:hypothetical protein [Sedimentibacter sp.]|uniref:hypothetical protein n=1 Tax=Sedimentibacter sp. TaxID=1960295 RepID=UPI0028AFC689|nr:hypothetical protein [Sedimentibacter sp.]